MSMQDDDLGEGRLGAPTTTFGPDDGVPLRSMVIVRIRACTSKEMLIALTGYPLSKERCSFTSSTNLAVLSEVIPVLL